MSARRRLAALETPPLLELDGVVKHYSGAAEQVRAVDGVSLGVAPGEMVSLRGPSGSGKTTLLLLIARLLRPELGSITFDGRDIASMGEQEACEYLMRDIGFVYQSSHLMPRVSCVENAAIKLVLGGMRAKEANRRAVDWLERLGLSQRLSSTPETLSGGERQRVAIARALVGEPRLILADEPTASLDSAKSAEIVELLRSVARERGVAALLVTHDAEVAAAADRQCLLRDGMLYEDGGRHAASDARVRASSAGMAGPAGIGTAGPAGIARQEQVAAPEGPVAEG